MYRVTFVILIIFFLTHYSDAALGPECNCLTNLRYCGSTTLQLNGTCNLGPNTNLYTCVTRGQPPVLKETCQFGCLQDPLKGGVCMQKDNCTCYSSGDYCGSTLKSRCDYINPDSLYRCDGAGTLPAFKFNCQNGCQYSRSENDTCSTGQSNAEGLKKIKKIVVFMQENRAFDHYYGTMSGVRGFNDPHLMNTSAGLPIFYQPSNKSPDVKNGQKYALPFRISGPKAGCTTGGSNTWSPNHAAWNNGKMDRFPSYLDESSMGYLSRTELNYYFQLAEQFTIGDMYFQSVMASTNPNRLVLWTNTIDARGETKAGPSIDNNQDIPFTWLTYTEQLEEAGISWRVWQDEDNFDDNPLEWFAQYKSAAPSSSLFTNGMFDWGINTFLSVAARGGLPQVSYVVAPTQLSEHPSNGPEAGMWLVQEVVNALTSSPDWEETVLIIDYDESGGFFDHVLPPMAPQGTIDEYISQGGNQVPIGPGFRVPLLVISPWTKGGNVFTELTDHTSVTQFIEQWALANGYSRNDVISPLMSSYRRNMFSDLTHVFNFNKTDTSFTPIVPAVPIPSSNHGRWNSTDVCNSLPGNVTTIPFGNQVYPTVEFGYKTVRGDNPGEGRFYVLELVDVGALTEVSGDLSMSNISYSKSVANQYFTMTPNAPIGYSLISNNQLCLADSLKFESCGNQTYSWLFIDSLSGFGHAIQNVKTNKYLSFDITAKSFSLQTNLTSLFKIQSGNPNNPVTTPSPSPTVDPSSTTSSINDASSLLFRSNSLLILLLLLISIIIL
ncbi:hypothetical protein PPL_02444 [Heterostelium album PN500]|uniref:Phospholipase C n=1 Tax=Heterostelium pallidum (strain ATCC 26659 / Pp 5 / PN500) TaxID=670386 RepID=D3B237_HETP5|nr:hypothetical protein PPL_02444 [Heterostelium album PN500]EFA84412.1 hypothetical protein PPL_02444 [Heterostelium album PN500]|eukprot:XP_020436526.1 hypothetical protein PPL_02444 [Heterostelium album PN500]